MVNRKQRLIVTAVREWHSAAASMSVIYRTLVSVGDRLVPAKLQPLWNSDAGPKTVFFWGAVVKGGLVVAGLGDLKRPADALSASQSLSLAATGAIWARWCLVIIPKNYPLFVVNSFVCGTNLYQLVRVLNYERSLRKKNAEGK